jgi:glycosyltransferase involved in cell wall biosynthesis
LSSGNLPAAAEIGGGERRNASPFAPLAVCHIASGDRWAGAEVQIATLLKFLAREERLRLSAIFLNPGRLAEEAGRCGIPVKVIPESENNFLRALGRSAEFLADRKVQILHSHRYKENLLAALLARRLHIPHIVRTQHGLPEPLRAFRAFKQGFIQTVDRLVARRSTDHVISVSLEMSRHLARDLGAQKIVTIPNGIDLEGVRSALTQEEAKQRLGIEPSCPVMGTVGRLEPVKRLDIFLRAAQLIQGERAITKFALVGDGREESRLKALARELGIEGRALFLGHRDDVYDVLRALDILVLSSDREGLPMVLLEALFLGVVVVARNVGGIPEVIQNGVNGVLVDSPDPQSLAEACAQILAEPARSQRLAEAGIKSVTEGYGAAKTADQVTRLYFSLCERT